DAVSVRFQERSACGQPSKKTCYLHRRRGGRRGNFLPLSLALFSSTSSAKVGPRRTRWATTGGAYVRSRRTRRTTQTTTGARAARTTGVVMAVARATRTTPPARTARATRTTPPARTARATRTTPPARMANAVATRTAQTTGIARPAKRTTPTMTNRCESF
ncbi:unnamed protein product, partial [Laminaria digitata]